MTEIHASARKHGIDDADVRHAVMFAIYSGEVGDDPIRVLYIGPDAAGNLLEVVTIVRADPAPELAIHAMRMRPQYQALLRKRRKR